MVVYKIQIFAFVEIDSNLSKIEADERSGPFETAVTPGHRVVLRLLSTRETVEMSLGTAALQP